VVGHDEMLVASNVERIIAGYDVILDGTDTFETRYLLNDAAVSPPASRSSTPASSGSRAS
jgi:molybdopterin/thiamine biosynthesis adenylyltransferase